MKEKRRMHDKVQQSALAVRRSIARRDRHERPRPASRGSTRRGPPWRRTPPMGSAAAPAKRRTRRAAKARARRHSRRRPTTRTSRSFCRRHVDLSVPRTSLSTKRRSARALDPPPGRIRRRCRAAPEGAVVVHGRLRAPLFSNPRAPA